MLRKSKRFWVCIICLAVVCLTVGALIAVRAYHVDVYHESWKMYGTWITDEEVSQDTVEFDFKAKVNDYVEQHAIRFDEIRYEFAFPDGFRYEIPPDNVYEGFSITEFLGNDYLGCPIRVRDLENHGYECEAYFALNLEKQYVMFDFRGDLGPTLVASADPDVDPQQILAFFDGYKKCWDAFYD